MSDSPAPDGYERMFLAAVDTLARIDAALGLPEDGCNNPVQTLNEIERLQLALAARDAEVARLQAAIDELVATEDADDSLTNSTRFRAAWDAIRALAQTKEAFTAQTLSKGSSLSDPRSLESRIAQPKEPT